MEKQKSDFKIYWKDNISICQTKSLIIVSYAKFK